MNKLVTLSVLLIILSIVSYAQPVVNGDLSDAQYITLSTKQNTNSNWGNIDISKIVYYPDAASSVLYLGVVGKLDVSNSNAIGIWLNVSGSGSPAGIAAGNSLSVSGGGGYIGGNGGTNPNFKADFEVDYEFSFNPGGGNTNVYWDASKTVGTPVNEYQGSCNQSGTSSTNSNANGTVFTQNSVSFAFNNDGAANHGLELAIPFAQIGANVNDSIQVFAFVVSSSAYFSDITVPGNLSSDPGFDADFTSLSSGPFHSGTPQPLPVELTSFSGSVNNNSVELKWSTATELNNFGFEIQRSTAGNPNSASWEKVGFVKGAVNSKSPKQYSFTDNTISSGKYSYRLKQLDEDGTYKYSNIVEVNYSANMPNGYLLDQNYPNPFNPSTMIKFGFEKNTHATLTIYDVLGNKVAELFNGQAEAGRTYEVSFNASALSSGIYYYQLQSDNITQVKKMMLLK